MEQKWTNKLNNAEFSLLNDTWYPLLKKSASHKVKLQLQELGKKMEVALPGYAWKISAGENLQDLPYQVLDYPKIASKEFSFLFRTLFWWGKPISYQVILRTQDFADFLDSIRTSTDFSLRVLVSEDIWDADALGSGYSELNAISEVQWKALIEKPYLKLAYGIDMKKPEALFEDALGFYQFFISYLLASQQGS